MKDREADKLYLAEMAKIDHVKKMASVSAEAAVFLNRAHEQFKNARTPDTKSFYALTLQMTIFHYEMTLEMSSLLNQKPAGFAAQVAIKDMIHKLFEYEGTMRGSHLKKIIELGERRGFTDAQDTVRKIKKDAGTVFSSIQKYSRLRNKATGHYDSVIEDQVAAIESIDTDAAQQTIGEFLKFNMEVLSFLKDIGKGNNEHCPSA